MLLLQSFPFKHLLYITATLVVISSFSFLILFIWVLSLFFLVSLAQGLSILFILSKNHLLVLLIVSIVFKFYLFIYLFIYGCVGSSFLCVGFLQLRQVGATLHRGAWASHYRGLSCWGAQAPDAQAQ